MDASQQRVDGKRHRVTKACDTCRDKRRKCRMTESGSCALCISHKLQCTFGQPARKRGPRGKKAPVEIFDTNMQRIDNVAEDTPNGIIKHSSVPTDLRLSPELQSELIQRLTRDVEADREKKRARKERKDRDDDNEDSEDNASISSEASGDFENSMDQLFIDEGGRAHYMGEASGLYFLKESLSYRNHRFQPHASAISYFDIRRTQQYMDELPPPEMVTELMRLYFAYMNSFMPIIDKTTFTLNILEHDILSNSVLALASRLLPEARRPTPRIWSEVFFRRAASLLDAELDNWRIESVQSLLLMAAYERGTAHASKAWLYDGMAFRIAQDLGLHRQTSDNVLTKDSQNRARVYWVCFVIDRLTSAANGKQPSLSNLDCTVPVPTADILTEEQGMHPTFVHLIKLADFLGKILQTVYKTHTGSNVAMLEPARRRLEDDFINWFTAIRHSSFTISPTQYIYLELYYMMTHIVLSRPFLPSPDKPRDQLTVRSLIKCTAAAYKIVTMTDALSKQGMLPYLWESFNDVLFAAGTIFARNGVSLNERLNNEARRNLSTVMHFLNELEKTWPVAARLRLLLQTEAAPLHSPRTHTAVGGILSLNKSLVVADGDMNPSSASTPPPQYAYVPDMPPTPGESTSPRSKDFLTADARQRRADNMTDLFPEGDLNWLYSKYFG